VVGVLGISSSSQARLLADLDTLGTNLLTVSPGVQLSGSPAFLPETAPGMIGRLPATRQVAALGLLPNVNAYRSDKIPSTDTGGIAVRAADLSLLSTLGATVAHGKFLNVATASYPAAVLGTSAAQYLGIADLRHGIQIYVAGQWFTVLGIVAPISLDPLLDRSVFVGYPAAEQYLHVRREYSIVYLRTDPDRVLDVRALLPRAANPAHPESVTVSRPSEVLEARLAAQTAYTSLFIGLGAIALLVGGVGVANMMLIAVLERQSEIGLRRALGATRGHVGAQFITEAMLLSGLGGLAGVTLGTLATTAFAIVNGWMLLMPLSAVLGGLSCALLMGGVAGLYPAMRAARVTPTEALRSV
jgi:putative ABC transport system permease protein